MSFFLIVSGQDLESLDLTSYEIPLDLINKRPLRTAQVAHDGLRIRVAMTCDSVGKFYEGDSFGLEKSDGLVAAFGYCVEYVDGASRRFDQESARRLIDRLVEGHYETSSLDGNYCLLAYTRTTGTAFVCGSQWGTYGTYYGSNTKCLAVSNRSAVIAEILGRPIDGIAYVSLLRNLPLPPERTLFSGVKSRLPRECLLVQAGAPTVKLLRRSLMKRELTVDPSVTAREEITRIVLDSCSDHGVMIDLSGGQDTRVTAAILSKHPRLVSDFGLTFKTTGSEGDPDVVLARTIARLYRWNHLVLTRSPVIDYDWDRFRFVSLLFDGSAVADQSLVGGYFRDAALSEQFPILVGSWGCELLRDHFFLPEYVLRMIGITRDLDGYFMVRARPNNDVELARITASGITMSAHDNMFLTTYRQFWTEIEGPLADKLNGIAVLRYLQKNRGSWAWGAFRRTTLPYTTDRAYAIAVSLGVRARLFNRFVSSLVCDADGRLAGIPTDRGAYLRPIEARYMGTHVSYYLKELTRIIRGKIAARKTKQPVQFKPLPRYWEDNLDMSDSFYEYPPSLNEMQVTPKEHREVLCILMLECLQKQYRNIRRALDFSS